MKRTSNLNLPLYEGTDKYYIDDFNEAYSKIDTAYGDLQETFNNTGSGSILTTQEVVEARKGENSLKTKIDNIDSQLAKKVNKTIQTFKPTLINGWVNYTNWNANYGYLIFYKDDMGIVHIEGTLTGGTTAYPFVLPVGFRPSKNILATASALQGVNGSIIVPLQAIIEKDSGNFGLFGWNTSLSRVAINISFKLI